MATVPTALAGRHFLKELDFTEEEFRGLIELAAELKAAKRAGTETRYLQGRNIALIFEKTSTRTRCAFEVAAADQGASTTYLDPAGSQIGHKESVKDTARVLGRMFDGIEYRGDSQTKVEELAAFAGVPVYNGLTDDWHPTQMLADVLTMTEHSDRPPRSADVRTTIVDGRVLMRDRELLTVDVSEVVRELGERLPALTDRGHGRRIQQYDT